MHRRRGSFFSVEVVTGVASYRALEHVPPVDLQLFNFSGHLRAAQNLTLDSTHQEKMYWPIALILLLHEFRNVFSASCSSSH